MIDAFGRPLVWWAGIGIRWPRSVLILAILLALSAGYGCVTRLGFDTNTDDMLSAELPFRQAYSVFQHEFPQFSNTILAVIDGETPETARAAARRLASRLQAESDVFQSAYLPRADNFMEQHSLLYLNQDKLEKLSDDLATMQPFLGILAGDPSLRGLFAMLEKALDAIEGGENIDLAPLLKRINRTLGETLAGRRHLMSWEELMQGVNASDERRQFLVVQPKLDYHHLLAAEPAIKRMRALAAELHLDAAHGLSMRLTGGAALAYEELISVSRGTGITAMIAMISVAIILFIGLGSLRLVTATLFTLVVGLTLTAGFATIAIGSLNLISVAFAVLYIGLAVDYAIHFCLHYRELQHQGVKQGELPTRTAREIGLSLLLCATTTAIGFFCFVPTAYTGVSELGLIAGSGMFIGLAVTLIMLPALLSLFPPPVSLPWHTASERLRALTDLPVRHRNVVRAGILALGIGAVWLLPQARFDYNPMHLRNQDCESVTTFVELMRDGATSPWRIMVLTQNAGQAASMAGRLKKLAAVDKAVFLGSFIPGDQPAKLDIIEDMALVLGAAIWPERTSPQPSVRADMQALAHLQHRLYTYGRTAGMPFLGETAQLERQLRLTANHLRNATGPGGRRRQIARLEHNLLATLPDNLGRLRLSLEASPVTPETLPPQLRERWLSPSGIYRIEVFPHEDISSNEALRRFVTAVQGVAPQATGAPVFILEAGKAVVKSFQQAFATALVAIFLLLLLVLRSLRDSLLIVTPLLFALALLNAAALAFGIDFNFANIIALPLLLGMGVDNGIHMVWRARTAMPASGNLLHTSTARAVLFSALTTICSFGSLSFSAHTGTASMGRILTLGVIIILIGSLIARPAFIRPVAKRRQT